MFARKFRLPSSQKLTQPNVIHSPLFVLKITKNNEGYNRYAFIVSKAIDKRAVVRNRLKRRVRAVVEEMHEKLSQGNDLLFILKKEGVAMTDEEINKLVTETLKIVK